MAKHVCPWWLAYTFDNPLRRLFHKPEKMLAAFARPGMTVMDLGCGMGFFSIGMAHLVGDHGKVIAVDLQQRMLDILMKRAARAGVAHRIQPVLCKEDDIMVRDMVDFAVAFWMVHETPDPALFLAQLYDCLKGNAVLLIAEPKIHVSGAHFHQTILTAQHTGFIMAPPLYIPFSHSATIRKPDN